MKFYNKDAFIKDNPGIDPKNNYEIPVDYIYFKDSYKNIVR